MVLEKLPSYMKWLLHHCEYPHKTSELRLIQTHISYIVCAGNFVYKWKKPVDFGFLDFSTLEKRKYYCKQELLLNRRLCPDIYLGLVTVTTHDGCFELNGLGQPIEYGVKMVRMPENRMMNKLIESSQLEHGDIKRIVNTLLPFYERVEKDPTIQKYGSTQTVSVNISENFQQTKKFVGGDLLSRIQFNTIQNYCNNILADEKLFEKRMLAGKIHDCHGDLHSGNICLAERVYIFDCIEFNERLRYSDVAADVAFLAMDLDYHGLSKMSAYFIESFIDHSSDTGMYEVLNFYKCYRAFVRGKISLLTAHDIEVDEETRRKCSDDAKRYFSLAMEYSEEKEKQ